MTETGTVIKIKKGAAVVRVNRKSGCDKCGMCAFKPGAPHIDVTLEDTLECRPGDEVEIEISDGGLMKISAAVYLLPLSGGLAGVAGAYFSGLPEAWQMAALAAGLALGFLGVFLVNIFYKKRNSGGLRLVKKIEKNLG